MKSFPEWKDPGLLGRMDGFQSMAENSGNEPRVLCDRAEGKKSTQRLMFPQTDARDNWKES